MTLEEYYKSASLFVASETTNQVHELRNDIIAFFEGFTKAYKQDLQIETATSVMQLNQAYCSNAYLASNKTKMLGLALYMMDFQKHHDSFFKNRDFNMHAFTYIVLKFNHPFEEAHYRLLEITEATDWAYMALNKDNIANYVLTQFSKIASREAIMKLYAEELFKMQERIEAQNSSRKFSEYVPQYILYKLLKRKLSPFRKF